jgi:hypothetical protein
MITVSVMYADPKKPEGILKHEFRPRQPEVLNFDKRYEDRYNGGNPDVYRSMEGSGPPCDFQLWLIMDGCPEYEKEMSSLQVKHWRVLLEVQSPY